MRKQTILRTLRISVFAAVMLSSATIFATQLLPIADRDPALIGPVNDFNPVSVAPAVTAVPEPATWGMLLLGGGLLAGVRRFRRKRM